MERPISTISLCGFMGCGKSTLARALADALGFALADTDDMLLEETGVSIAQMFAIGGEAYFRDREHEIVRKAALLERTVLSTGGGVMTFPRNAQLLASNTLVVYVHRDFDACYAAVSRRKNRPIANQKSREELLRMYNDRLPAYRRYASFTLYNTGTPQEAIAPLIASLHGRMV